MALGPMDIHHKEFNTVRMGGYNKEEVDAFLDQVADELDRLIHRNQELMTLAESMRAKVAEYESMQQTLQNALINAQKSADAIVQDARTQAEQAIQQAQAQASQLLEKARSEAEALNRQASQARDAAVREAAAEKQRLLSELSGIYDAAEFFFRAVRDLVKDLDSRMLECESKIKTVSGTVLEKEKVGVDSSESMADALPPQEVQPSEPAVFGEVEISTAGSSLIEETATVPGLTVEPIPGPTEPIEAPIFSPPPLETAAPQPEPAIEYPATESAEVRQVEPMEEAFTPSPTPSKPAAPEQGISVEPQAYVPPIAPLMEAREEEAPIPPLKSEVEMSPSEPQAYVPPIRLSSEGMIGEEEKLTSAMEEPTPQATQPPTPGAWVPDQPQESPPPETGQDSRGIPEEPREEKHFFWE